VDPICERGQHYGPELEGRIHDKLADWIEVEREAALPEITTTYLEDPLRTGHLLGGREQRHHGRNTFVLSMRRLG
jgi:hypothetical protein